MRQADVIIAGGVESMSMVPMTGYKPSPNPTLVEHYAEIYMGMGHTAEEVARRYGVTREDQDASPWRAIGRPTAAIQDGQIQRRDRSGRP